MSVFLPRKEQKAVQFLSSPNWKGKKQTMAVPVNATEYSDCKNLLVFSHLATSRNQLFNLNRNQTVHMAMLSSGEEATLYCITMV